MSLDSIKPNDRCILVEGPKWGDAAFYGKWLLAAAKANELWLDAARERGATKLAESMIGPRTVLNGETR